MVPGRAGRRGPRAAQIVRVKVRDAVAENRRAGRVLRGLLEGSIRDDAAPVRLPVAAGDVGREKCVVLPTDPSERARKAQRRHPQRPPTHNSTGHHGRCAASQLTSAPHAAHSASRGLPQRFC